MIVWYWSTGWSPGWISGLILAAYLPIALAVTIHVLLRQSNVRAALGWISLAWFSPILGGLIYYVFGINRVARRAGKLDRPSSPHALSFAIDPLSEKPPNISRLAEIGFEIVGHPVVGGNRVSILRGGDEAYPAMLSAIRDAKASIALASYIFRDDEVGIAFSDALSGARSRGVEICVLLDGIGSGYFRWGALRRLRTKNISAERFLHTWLPWRMPFLNIRNHKKLLIVDGTTGFTGGMNIGAEYSASRAKGVPVRDIHCRFDGPIVSQLMESFNQDWSFTTDQTLDRDIWWPNIEALGSVFARGISSGPDVEINKLETLLGAALAQARKKVRIVTPYFLPDESLQFALAQASLRGVVIEIVIPEHCDFRLLDWAMRAHLRFFTGVPMTVYETMGPFDHAKLMTVDGEWALVGSSNWDARSLRLNFEFDVECYDGDVISRIDALIDERVSQSRKMDPSRLLAAPNLMRLRDAAARLFLPYL